MTVRVPSRRADGVALAASLVPAVLLAALPATVLPPALGALALAGLVAWIVQQDATRFTIPDGAVAGLALLGAAFRLADGAAALHDPWRTGAALAIDAVVCGGALLLVREAFYRRRGYDGLGFGDVKLAFAGGILIGTEGFALGLCGACLGALALVLVRWCRSTRPGDPIALGVFLAPAILAVWALGRFGLLLAAAT